MSLRETDLIPALLTVTQKAAREVMAVYDGHMEISEKADASPVTEADRRGEAVITAALEQLTPAIPVVGEEAVADGKRPSLDGERQFWLVDPLDGTKEFIRKGTDFTVNIGLIRDGAPCLGVVAAPARDIIYWGVVGEGAWAAPLWQDGIADGTADAARAIHTRQGHTGPLTIVASRSHRSEALEAWLAHFPDAEHVSFGSSLKLCQVASGDADLYPRLGPTCEWDTAAADAVLRAAGGIVLAPDGAPLAYGKDTRTFLNPWFLAKGNPGLKTPALA
ncbi:3'(2'),5'-bisphosphate nucleotidase CysQ [Eilatimonas milleporae]|uniref:3'(2'),5'-bisphosphate nucleotidase CysQ n=1 Tax=Eilatimonas milleporae TaxID=911205 RepID=A0A3M0CRJ7_9PROT|nr:3'(2'),5'-bisphosphate nucleotidase CysQ [Eilatimonas milleporae]RMB12181.1 3'(2'),5'-bisphosphate nucleotidase [Eilatimonas milleporae]